MFEKQVTLCRAAYGRPETWRFLFSARLISAPATGVADQANVSMWFELFTGIGRSAIHIPFWINLPSYVWNFGAAVPANLVTWTNVARTDNTSFSIDSGGVSWDTTILTDQIIGQDITVVAHAKFTTDIPGVTQPAILEVSGQISPNTHVRPDWMQVDALPAEQFAGGEVKGR